MSLILLSVCSSILSLSAILYSSEAYGRVKRLENNLNSKILELQQLNFSLRNALQDFYASVESNLKSR